MVTVEQLDFDGVESRKVRRRWPHEVP